MAALTDGREDKITKLAQSNQDDWRASALSVIQSSLSDVQPHSAYPVGMMNLLRFPIIKKSGHRTALQWQESAISAVEHGAIAPLPDAVLAELKSIVAAIHARPRATDL